MTNNIHRLVDIDKIELIGSQKCRCHLENIRIGKVLPNACSLANREWNYELLEIPGSSVVEAIRVKLIVIFAPEVRIVVEGMYVKRHLSLENKQVSILLIKVENTDLHQLARYIRRSLRHVLARSWAC